MALALAIGTAGGWAATHLAIPLPWMIGAMIATTTAAVAGVPIMVWTPLRTLFVAVLGVMLGSGFTPEILGQMADWAASLTALTACAAASAAVGTWFFHKVAGYDRATSYFAAMPGGLSEMIVVGEAMGGNTRTISLIHGARVLLVVLTLPFAFQLLMGYDPGDGAAPGPAFLDIAPRDLAILAACGLVGYFGARAIRIPAAQITGPMLVSAAVHLTGATDVGPPEEAVAAAQVVIGSVVGSRFAGTRIGEILNTVLWAAAGTAVLLAVTLAFAWVVSRITALDFAVLTLAFAPGGLAEMSLVALALGMEATFVATHHIIRIVLIVVLAPLVFRLTRRAWQP